MNFEELEHIVRAAGEVTGETEFIAIGSQSLLVSFRDLPRELRRSPELDITARSNPQVADLIDGNLGEITPFHQTFHIYAHGVGPESATLASGWESRLRKAATPAMNGAVVYGLSPEDLAYAKLAAGREKDIDFVRGMVQHGIVSQVLVGRLIGSCPDPELQTRLSERFTVAVGLTQIGDQHGKKPGLSAPVRRAINEGRGKGNPER
ncbi:MAG TPA: DUF6036 family nucleotidyltransferase [Chthoniobacterales bacterium]|jgi:hypothetical protein|nr:DUF6036 family nucleotidyltransferase [Chthoniobacterales bacterium]